MRGGMRAGQGWAARQPNLRVAAGMQVLDSAWQDHSLATPCSATPQAFPPQLTQPQALVGLLLQRAGGEGRQRLPLLLPRAGLLHHKLGCSHALGNGARLVLVSVAGLGRSRTVHLSDAGLWTGHRGGQGRTRQVSNYECLVQGCSRLVGSQPHAYAEGCTDCWSAARQPAAASRHCAQLLF